MIQNQFQPEKHYSLEAQIGCIVLSHTHWEKTEDGKVISLFRADLTAYSKDVAQRTTRASLDSWAISPEELDHLADQMRRAAANLRAQLVQVSPTTGLNAETKERAA